MYIPQYIEITFNGDKKSIAAAIFPEIPFVACMKLSPTNSYPA